MELNLPNPIEQSEYNYKLVEKNICAFWEKRSLFLANPSSAKKPFSIAMPPPNVTGTLHLGHVWDNIIQDIIIRFKKMQGYEVCWVPGTDHAGIATQHVVEENLKKRGLSKEKLGREKFIEEVWKWKEKSEKAIIEQLKKLGLSCDWSRYCFTMDAIRSKAVREAFCRLYENNLIYRGKYIINWCPHCETALADDEVEYSEEAGKLYYIRYPIVDGGFAIVATTRPETILADVALAYHPSDDRYRHLKDRVVTLPIVGRNLRVIEDSFVDPNFGTGLVKITPGHDYNDYLIGMKFNLPVISVIDKKGVMNEEAGLDYKGLDRFSCREKIVSDLKNKGLLEKVEDKEHRIGRCYRCDNIIEPMVSLQWFVKMKPLAELAIKAVQDGEIKIFPDKWNNTYFAWLNSVRDWCISRQIWWGHRIPVWYCNDCGKVNVSRVDIDSCSFCGSGNLEEEKDVLDTWFSSWLWPFSIFGWPDEDNKDYNFFYPTSVLNSGRDILFFWDTRMIMAGLFFTKKVPFKHLYLHGLARDEKGRKISKSLGNSPDIDEMFEKFGTDGVRLAIIANAPIGEDCYISDDMLKFGKFFANKLWNSARFILLNINKENAPGSLKEEYFPINKDKLIPEDRWILSKLHHLIQGYTERLENYEFSEAVKLLNNFFWHTFCDWYIELVKDRLGKKQNADTGVRENNSEATNEEAKTPLGVLINVFLTTLKLLHPIQPFITEALYQIFKGKCKTQEGDETLHNTSIVQNPWPTTNREFLNPGLEKQFETIFDIIRSIRDVRNSFNISKDKVLSIYISPFDNTTMEFIIELKYLISKLERVKIEKIEVNLQRPQKCIGKVMSEATVFISLEGLPNLENECKKLLKRKEEIENLLMKIKKEIENEEFLQRAPEEVVIKERERFRNLSRKLEVINSEISQLQSIL